MDNLMDGLSIKPGHNMFQYEHKEEINSHEEEDTKDIWLFQPQLWVVKRRRNTP